MTLQNMDSSAMAAQGAKADATKDAERSTRAKTFELANGMKGVVIPDHRAPVVTHMVWYKAGAADEWPGVSGVAHFLEHLMFKATDAYGSGEFSKRVAQMGGQDNAFTGHDMTAYYQRIAKDRLPVVMEMEAIRMTRLKLEDKEIATERDVILEERRTRTDNNPSALLGEQMNAALYLAHPYRTPVIGWMNEMKLLSRAAAVAYYKRFYAPNNAYLIVAGDVDVDEVKKLAEATYGKIPRNDAVKPYDRPREPVQRAERQVTLKDQRVGKASFHRYYLAPSYTTAKGREAEALDLLMKAVAYGATSRIYRELVVKQKVASSAGGWYSGAGRDYGKIAVYGVPADGKTVKDVEAAIDQVLADVVQSGVTQAELDRARRVYIADYTYESDSQSTLARRYGYGLIVGQSIEEIENWPRALQMVTVQDTKDAAKKHLVRHTSVTGYLLPDTKQKADAAGKANGTSAPDGAAVNAKRG